LFAAALKLFKVVWTGILCECVFVVCQDIQKDTACAKYDTGCDGGPADDLLSGSGLFSLLPLLVDWISFERKFDVHRFVARHFQATCCGQVTTLLELDIVSPNIDFLPKRCLAEIPAVDEDARVTWDADDIQDGRWWGIGHDRLCFARLDLDRLDDGLHLGVDDLKFVGPLRQRQCPKWSGVCLRRGEFASSQNHSCLWVVGDNTQLAIFFDRGKEDLCELLVGSEFDLLLFLDRRREGVGELDGERPWLDAQCPRVRRFTLLKEVPTDAYFRLFVVGEDGQCREADLSAHITDEFAELSKLGAVVVESFCAIDVEQLDAFESEFCGGWSRCLLGGLTVKDDRVLQQPSFFESRGGAELSRSKTFAFEGEAVCGRAELTTAVKLVTVGCHC